jgi:hypothetical protein
MFRKSIATLLLLALPALPAFAGKPDDPGNGKGKGKGNSQKSQGGGSGNKGGSQGHGGGGNASSSGDSHDYHRFTSDDRNHWREYWGEQYEHGHCPPGLAKKHNGCMPPGQAKKRYSIGHPLPRDIVIFDVPTVLLPRLAPLPPGYRYGIVDGDLVQLAVGTLLVVDAIEGLLN